MTQARTTITQTAQAAAENAAGVVGSVLNNDTVSSGIDTATEIYRKNPLAVTIGIAVLVAAIATVITRAARR